MKKFSPTRKIYSKKTLEKLDAKIKLLGSNTKLSVDNFLNIRLIISITIFFISLFIFEHYGYLLAPFLAIAFYILTYYYFIDYKISKRTIKLEKEAVTFFEVLLLSVEAGNDLLQSLITTSNNVDSEFSSEFKITINEVKYSKTLNKALKDMRKRIPSDNINNIILNISEASLFGGNIIDTLNNQIDFLQEKRIQHVRGEINKLPIKISIVSVLFFIPLILLLILAPVLINIIY